MIHLKQPSTKRGLLLLLSSIAAVFGYGDLFSADITEQGVEIGGAIANAAGVIVPAAIGLYETVRNEFSEQSRNW
ncbi:hypothetical protein AB2S62_21705 [Vibrio sp. NTOU-M3]|uniref:hypothetical protein n=1 Tax=Vibrio sp. NTOU-M3 TaxID=3234954 RepID=UPI00349F0795